MGFIKNRIAVPLIDAFGEAVMSSNIGKQIYRHVDDRINNATKQLSSGLSSQMQDASESLGRRLGDVSEDLGLTLGASALTGGMLGGAGALAGGGLSGLVSGSLSPVVSNALYPENSLSLEGLPPEMQDKLRILVKRSL